MSGTVINYVIFTSTQLCQHQACSTGQQEKRNDHNKNWQCSMSLWLTEQGLREQKMWCTCKPFQFWTQFSTPTSNHQTARPFRRSDVTVGQSSYRQSPTKRLAVGFMKQTSVLGDSSPTLSYTGRQRCSFRLGSVSSVMDKDRSGSRCSLQMSHGSPCTSAMKEFEFWDVQESAPITPL